MRKLTCLILFALIGSTISAAPRASARLAPQPADLLQILPDGSGVVVIDLQKITTSALWSTVSAQQKLKSAIDKAQSEISEFGMKLNDLRAIALVFPSAGFNNPVTAINGSFDQKDLLDRLRSSTKIKLTSEKYKNFDVYKVTPVPTTDSKSSTNSSNASAATVRNETSFAFRDTSTIVVGAAESVRASIDVISGSRPSINQNTQLIEALGPVSSSAVRFAIAITPSMTNGLQSSDFPIPDFSTLKLIYGSIDVASGIDINATLRSDSDEHAKALAGRLNGLLEMARGYLGAAGNAKNAWIVDMLKAVNITNSNADVKVTGSLSADLLSGLLSPSGKKSQ